MKQLTKEQALEFNDSKKYEAMSDREKAEFQIMQDRLCMPFSVFHEAVTKTIGRDVYTHEFGLNREGIQAEIFDRKEAPSLEDIISLLPADKTIVVTE